MRATILTTAPAVRFEGVRASYGRIEALYGVDLEVPAGSIFAVLGPNGRASRRCSKWRAASCGRRPGPSRSRPLRAAGLTGGLRPQRRLRHSRGRGVFPNLSVRDNLSMWTYQGTGRPEAEERAYTRFPRLKERRRQLAGTLSGGEQQMLAIARALVGSPRLLLLDEISMGLAPMVVGELYELVAHIAADGVTVIVVEQFVSTAVRVADHAAILLHGRVHQQGSPDEMAEAALGAYLSSEG